MSKILFDQNHRSINYAVLTNFCEYLKTYVNVSCLRALLVNPKHNSRSRMFVNIRKGSARSVYTRLNRSRIKRTNIDLFEYTFIRAIIHSIEQFYKSVSI